MLDSDEITGELFYLIINSFLHVVVKIEFGTIIIF